jgi:hypothetical protein
MIRWRSSIGHQRVGHLLLILLIALAGMTSVHAQSPDDSMSIELIEHASPIVPTLSTLYFRSPVIGRLFVDAWYSAYSPFLIPKLFLEIGSVIRLRAVDQPVFTMDTSIGLAWGYEPVDGKFGLPLVMKCDLLFRLPLNLTTGLSLMYLTVLDDGVGVEASVPIRFEPAGPFYGGVSLGYVGYFVNQKGYMGMKNSLFVGYRIREAL